MKGDYISSGHKLGAKVIGRKREGKSVNKIHRDFKRNGSAQKMKNIVSQ